MAEMAIAAEGSTIYTYVAISYSGRATMLLLTYLQEGFILTARVGTAGQKEDPDAARTKLRQGVPGKQDKPLEQSLTFDIWVS